MSVDCVYRFTCCSAPVSPHLPTLPWFMKYFSTFRKIFLIHLGPKFPTSFSWFTHITSLDEKKLYIKSTFLWFLTFLGNTEAIKAAQCQYTSIFTSIGASNNKLVLTMLQECATVLPLTVTQ